METGFAFAGGNNLTADAANELTVAQCTLIPVTARQSFLLSASLLIGILDVDTTVIQVDYSISPDFDMPSMTFDPALLSLDGMVAIPLPSIVLAPQTDQYATMTLQVRLTGATGPSTGIYGAVSILATDVPTTD